MRFRAFLTPMILSPLSGLTNVAMPSDQMQTWSPFGKNAESTSLGSTFLGGAHDLTSSTNELAETFSWAQSPQSGPVIVPCFLHR